MQKGVAKDTIHPDTGERLRIMDGTEWGTWMVGFDKSTLGELERLAWQYATCMYFKPDPRPPRVVTQMKQDGTVIVMSMDEKGEEPVPVSSFCGLSLQEVQQRMQLER